MTRLGLTLLVLAAISGLTAFALPHLPPARAATAPNPNETPASPVLIELFTSEGCSSCPPADALLAKLDRSQPVSGADLIVLSEHVDYWDDIGWKDPYSSRQFSVRQGDYAQRLRAEPYTPQMVVDGDRQLVGSDEGEALKAAGSAAKAAKLPVKLSSIRAGADGSLAIHLDVGPAVSSARPSGEIWIVLADDSDQSSVIRGENAGRVLKHVAVVRKMAKVAVIDRTGSFSGNLKVSAGNANLRNLRIVAFVQEPGAGKVLGAGSARLSN